MNAMGAEWLLEIILSVEWGAHRVFAQTGRTGPPTGSTGPPGEHIDLPNPLGTDDLVVVVGRVIDVLFRIAVPLLAVMILIGGFQLMTAGGNEEQVKKGRKTLLYAVVGFAIILIAEGVVFIIRDLLGS